MQKSYIVIVAIVAVVVILFGIWYFVLRRQTAGNQNTPSQNQQTATVNTQQATTATAGLGAQIYQQTQNPLQNKLPDTNPVKNANPLKGAYTNPF